MNRRVEDDFAKQAAACAGAQAIRSGMRVGLGCGSTMEMFIRSLGERVRTERLRIECVAACKRSEALAADLDIPLVPLSEVRHLDVMVDSADEFDRDLNLIKGSTGNLLREKILAGAATRRLIIADHSKEAAWLGNAPLPVEVVAFGARATQQMIEERLIEAKLLNKRITVRMQGQEAFVTDQGNRVLDLHLGRIPNPAGLAQMLTAIPGVVDHGLFLGMADSILIGYADGRVDLRKR